MGIIYLIKNTINNKCYIGQTIRTLNVRWQEHCNPNDECRILNNAITKYTPDVFNISILIECDNSKLNDLEKHYIIEYNTLYPNGYNIKSGGSQGSFHCENSREKMRLSKLGDKNPNFGKPRNDITKEKISASKKGEKHHFFGKELSFEHKIKLSKAHKTTELPMYLVYLKARPSSYQSEGYAITNHPNGKNKYFTSGKISLNEKYQSALEYLNKLNSL